MNGLMLSAPKISMAKKGIAIVKNAAVKEAPIILSGIAIGGVVSTGILAYRAGIKANALIEEARLTKEAEGFNGDLTLKEKAEVSWKAYIPVAVSGIITIGAIVASTTISKKRQAALAGLYAVSEAALKEYQDKVEKEVGPKKEQAIRDSINEDRVKNEVIPSQYDVLPADKVLIKDKLSGRIFLGSVENIRRAANDLNYRIVSGDMLASLNEFYEDIGLDGIDLGMECGWNLANLCEPYFTASMTSDMRPILVLDWSRDHAPVVNYRDI